MTIVFLVGMLLSMLTGGAIFAVGAWAGVRLTGWMVRKNCGTDIMFPTPLKEPPGPEVQQTRTG